MMMAADAEDGFNFGSLNYLFDDDDDDIDDRLPVCVDADSIFGILDEDDQNPPPLLNDPFYPSTEGTQECGSAAHVGNHEDPLLQEDYGAVSGNSTETMESPEQLLHTSPLVNGSEYGGFQLLYYVDTDYVPSAQDWFGDFNISADFPNQGLFDGASYDLMLATGPTRNNVKDTIDNAQDSHSCLENEIVLDAQVGDANITASEVPIFDFFDGKRPESIIHGSDGAINAYDSGSSTTTDDASLEPCLWGLIGQSCETQAVEMSNEKSNALLTGFGCNTSQSSEEASLRGFSFGSISHARSFLASTEAQHIGVYDGTSVHCHIPAIDRKPIDPVKRIQVASGSSLSEARNEEDDDDLCIMKVMSQLMPLDRCSTHGKSLVTLRRQTFTTECSAITTSFRQC